jgi:hypothetical protein
MDEVTETAEVETEPKGMRAQIESLSAELRDFKSDKRDGIISELGLDAASGLGLVLVEQFDSGALPLDKIAETATGKYGHVVPEVAPLAHPQAQAITEGTERLDAIEQTAGSIVNPTEGDVLAKAEAEGDYATTMAIKGQQIAALLK